MSILLNANVSWGWIGKNLTQPMWCIYPNALHPMGCWSLIDRELRKKISKDFCKTCDLFSDK